MSLIPSLVFKYALWGYALQRGRDDPKFGALCHFLENDKIDEENPTYKGIFDEAAKAIRRDGLDRLCVEMLRHASYNSEGLPIFNTNKAHDSAQKCAKLAATRFITQLRNRIGLDGQSSLFADAETVGETSIDKPQSNIFVDDVLEVGRNICAAVEADQAKRLENTQTDSSSAMTVLTHSIWGLTLLRGPSDSVCGELYNLLIDDISTEQDDDQRYKNAFNSVVCAVQENAEFDPLTAELLSNATFDNGIITLSPSMQHAQLAMTRYADALRLLQIRNNP